VKSLLRIPLVLLVLGLPAVAQEFRYVSFDIPGCSLTSPFGVNARGQISWPLCGCKRCARLFARFGYRTL
jgi:hypothetical protein